MPLSLLALALFPQSQHVRPPVRVDVANSGSAERVASDIEDRLAVVTWVDDSLGGEHVWCSASTDGGQSFGAAVPVDADPSGADKGLLGSSIRVAGGSAYACWMDGRNGNADLYFSFSRDRGVSWSAPLRLDDGHGGGFARVELFRLVVDAPSQLVAVLMRVSAPGIGSEVRLVRSTDAGLSFGPSTLFRLGSNVGRVDLDFDAGRLHAVWQDDKAAPGFLEPRYQRSDDLGLTWLPTAARLAPGLMTDPSDLRVLADGPRVAVVWQEISALCSAALNLSKDGGDTWLPYPRRVAGSISPACMPQNPRPFFTPNELVVAWADDRLVGGLRTPWLAWTSDDGATWTERQLFNTPGSELRIRGDSDRGTFAVLWNGGTQIYASVSRAAHPEPQPVFVVHAGGHMGHVGMARDGAYDDLFSAWLERTGGGDDHVWAAGFRAANLVPAGLFQAGQSFHFEASNFPHDEHGWRFQVAVALAPGATPLPFGDGRLLGLASDRLFLATAGDPLLRGRLLPDGSGTTPSLIFPASVPPGTALRLAAVSFAPGPVAFGAITDVRTVFVN
ncbi:MAG: exo-alpha-sialidase [Planctomycetes bacterium]|nr:exo-alpha-sialidase [Planctomycetota bacterium]